VAGFPRFQARGEVNHPANNVHRDVVVFVIGVCHPDENACVDDCD